MRAVYFFARPGSLSKELVVRDSSMCDRAGDLWLNLYQRREDGLSSSVVLDLDQIAELHGRLGEHLKTYGYPHCHTPAKWADK